MKSRLDPADTRFVLRTRTIVVLAIATGVALEVGIQLLSGRSEAWDSALFWTLGLPIVAVIAVAIGLLSRQRDWLYAFIIVPSQLAAMMVRAGEIGNLWPLALILGAILSIPFVALSFVGSRFRPKH